MRRVAHEEGRGACVRTSVCVVHSQPVVCAWSASVSVSRVRCGEVGGEASEVAAEQQQRPIRSRSHRLHRPRRRATCTSETRRRPAFLLPRRPHRPQADAAGRHTRVHSRQPTTDNGLTTDSSCLLSPRHSTTSVPLPPSPPSLPPPSLAAMSHGGANSSSLMPQHSADLAAEVRTR